MVVGKLSAVFRTKTILSKESIMTLLLAFLSAGILILILLLYFLYNMNVSTSRQKVEVKQKNTNNVPLSNDTTWVGQQIKKTFTPPKEPDATWVATPDDIVKVRERIAQERSASEKA